MRLIRLLLRFSGYLTLAALTLGMVFWPIVEGALGTQNKMTAIGVALGILSGFVVYFDQKIQEILQSGQHLKHDRLGNALLEAFALKSNRVQTLRIYALTSEVIQPIIRNLRVDINDCFVMLHHFDESGHVKHAKALNSQVETTRKKWVAFKDSGRIKSLKTTLYDDLPYEYEIILDNEIMVCGMYMPNDDSPHGNDFVDPVIIINKSVDAAKLIDKHVNRFDFLFSYWTNAEQRNVPLIEATPVVDVI